MKITHPSGSSYDLHPGTELEITRFNPFFHELGEQSIPISMPASDRNLSILGHPDRPDNARKITTRLDATIQSGAFNVTCRQAILSAQHKGNIDTSFYLHEGAFYEKIADLTLAEIFQDKKIEFADIDTAINFMYSLVANNDHRFAVFEVITNNYTLNESSLPLRPDGLRRFRTEVPTEEVIDDKSVTIPKGFYLTPFIKVKHLLQEVLQHLGYSLAPSFLDDAPFNEMVFLNDNLDTIVGNSINYVDIVPNVTVKTFFDVLRKFNVELIPDETRRIVSLVPFSTAYNAPVATDISNHAVSTPVVSYPESYQQLKLSSERLPLPDTISMITSFTQFRRREVKIGTSDHPLQMIEILAQFPTAYLRHVDGAIVRDGFRGDGAFVEKLTSLSHPYFAGGPLAAEEHTFPDVVPDVFIWSYQSQYTTLPYVGSGRALQSKITFTDKSEQEGSTGELKPMLCLTYRTPSHCVGTLYSHDNAGNKIWDFSLMWWGEDGIFEKFWRDRDTLLRNAFLDLQVDLLLPEAFKLNIPSTRRVSLHGQNYLISELQYSTKADTVGSAHLRSVKLQEPLSVAKEMADYFPQKTYKWNVKRQYSYTGSGISYRYIYEPVAFFPADPTAAQYAAGGRYHSRTYEMEYGRIDSRTGEFDVMGTCTLTTWLEASLY